MKKKLKIVILCLCSPVLSIIPAVQPLAIIKSQAVPTAIQSISSRLKNITFQNILKTAKQNKFATGLTLGSALGATIYHKNIMYGAKRIPFYGHYLNENLGLGDKIKLLIFFTTPVLAGFLLKHENESYSSAISYQMLITLTTVLPQLIWMGGTMSKLSQSLFTTFETFSEASQISPDSLTPTQQHIANYQLAADKTNQQKIQNLEKEIQNLEKTLFEDDTYKNYSEINIKIYREEQDIKVLENEIRQQIKIERFVEDNKTTKKDGNKTEKLKDALKKKEDEIVQRKITVTELQTKLNNYKNKSTNLTNLLEKQNELQKLKDATPILPHALLFEGPPGTGKSETIRLLKQKHKDKLVVYVYPKDGGVSSTIIQTFKNFVITEALQNPNTHFIIYIDEADGVVGERGGVRSEDQSSSTHFLDSFCNNNYILPEHDQPPANLHLVFITNHQTLIESAVLDRIKKHGSVIAFNPSDQEETYFKFIKKKITNPYDLLQKICEEYSKLPQMSWRGIVNFVNQINNANSSEKYPTAYKLYRDAIKNFCARHEKEQEGTTTSSFKKRLIAIETTLTKLNNNNSNNSKDESKENGDESK